MSLQTPGELARQSFEAFGAIKQIAENGEPPADIIPGESATAFVMASLALVAKLPPEARPGFKQQLPFSNLEVNLLEGQEWAADPEIKSIVTKRLLAWVSLSAYYVDEHRAGCAEFLTNLTPFLDLWDERVAAQQMAESFR